MAKQLPMLGINDIHVAGHARSKGLMLITNNVRELERVEALRIADWTAKITLIFVVVVSNCLTVPVLLVAQFARP